MRVRSGPASVRTPTRTTAAFPSPVGERLPNGEVMPFDGHMFAVIYTWVIKPGSEDAFGGGDELLVTG